jgi:hypothetical protein
MSDKKGDNEMKLGAFHKSPVIYLTTEDDLGKPHLIDPMKFVHPVNASSGVPYLQMISVGSQDKSWRKEGKDDRKCGPLLF